MLTYIRTFIRTWIHTYTSTHPLACRCGCVNRGSRAPGQRTGDVCLPPDSSARSSSSSRPVSVGGVWVCVVVVMKCLRSLRTADLRPYLNFTNYSPVHIPICPNPSTHNSHADSHQSINTHRLLPRGPSPGQPAEGTAVHVHTHTHTHTHARARARGMFTYLYDRMATSKGRRAQGRSLS
jgi:hypothetical protein